MGNSWISGINNEVSSIFKQKEKIAFGAYKEAYWLRV